jgi:hypothetical protein
LVRFLLRETHRWDRQDLLTFCLHHNQPSAITMPGEPA